MLFELTSVFKEEYYNEPLDILLQISNKINVLVDIHVRRTGWHEQQEGLSS